eukprot:2340254-Heterocapsa_arctica.AAC.1
MLDVDTDMCDWNKRRSEGCLVCQPTLAKADRTICQTAETSADACAASCLRTDAGGGTTDACVALSVQRGCVGCADDSVAEVRSRNDGRHYPEDTCEHVDRP